MERVNILGTAPRVDPTLAKATHVYRFSIYRKDLHMDLYHWHITSRKKGSAAPFSAYIARDASSGYSGRNDLVAAGSGNLPEWCEGNPKMFWEHADLHERKNASACRDLVLSLPRELAPEKWKWVVERYIEKDIAGKPFQYAIHLAHSDDDGQIQPHVHVMYSDRVQDEHPRSGAKFFRRYNGGAPDQGGARKDSGGKSPKQLRIAIIERKAKWAQILKSELATARPIATSKTI